jgi:hypothetical protein
MTLSTNVYVLDPVSPHELFRFCQTLLTRFDEAHRPWSRQECSDKPAGAWSAPGAWRIANRIGQDLPAILDITYRPDGPLRTPEQAAEHDEDCDEDCSGEHYRRACWLDLDFDTAYSYQVDGMGCGDLHAALVAEVGKFLDQRAVRWEWRNEFTGEVHGGDDRYAQLVALCSGGFEAAAWYTHTVLPAIMSGALGQGGAS